MGTYLKLKGIQSYLRIWGSYDPIGSNPSETKKGVLYECSVKNQIFGPFLAHKRALMPPRRPPCKAVNAKPLSFRRPVMMVTIFFEAVHQKLISGQKTAFLGPKRATLGNRGRETARRAAKRPSTGKPKVSRVTSGYGGHVISPVRCV